MTPSGRWFPDFVAGWYDDFLKEHHQPFIAKVRHNQPNEVRSSVARLLEDPHGYALALDAKIAAATGLTQSDTATAPCKLPPMRWIAQAFLKCTMRQAKTGMRFGSTGG